MMLLEKPSTAVIVETEELLHHRARLAHKRLAWDRWPTLPSGCQLPMLAQQTVWLSSM